MKCMNQLISLDSLDQKKIEIDLTLNHVNEHFDGVLQPIL